MVETFKGFSILKLCQQDKLKIDTRPDFLKQVNPVILRLLRKSDQHQFLSRYLTMIDESFLALMDEYPPHALALQISIMMYDDVFPDIALLLGFQLPAFWEEDDKLEILAFSDDLTDVGLTKAHRSILREFLVDPTRSRHHHFLSPGPRLYAMALLGCFDYLSKVVILEDCSVDEPWLNQHATPVVSSEEMTVENQGGYAILQNKCDEIIPGSEEYTTIDTEKDMRGWQRGWRDIFEASGLFHWTAMISDLPTLSKSGCFVLISSVHPLIDMFFRTGLWT